VVDISSLLASLSIFNETSMDQIRQKSLLITAYLEHLLMDSTNPDHLPYRIITSLNPQERGAQLSILLKAGLLPPVFQKLSDEGFVFDQRKPDVIRIAPAPLYNSFWEVWLFVKEFKAALQAVPKN
jgi:kynureninase